MTRTFRTDEPDAIMGDLAAIAETLIEDAQPCPCDECERHADGPAANAWAGRPDHAPWGIADDGTLWQRADLREATWQTVAALR